MAFTSPILSASNGWVLAKRDNPTVHACESGARVALRDRTVQSRCSDLVEGHCNAIGELAMWIRGSDLRNGWLLACSRPAVLAVRRFVRQPIAARNGAYCPADV